MRRAAKDIRPLESRLNEHQLNSVRNRSKCPMLVFRPKDLRDGRAM